MTVVSTVTTLFAAPAGRDPEYDDAAGEAGAAAVEHGKLTVIPIVLSAVEPRV